MNIYSYLVLDNGEIPVDELFNAILENGHTRYSAASWILRYHAVIMSNKEFVKFFKILDEELTEPRGSVERISGPI